MANANAKLITLNTNKKEIEAICESAQKVLDSENNISISNALGIATIVYEFLNAAGRYLDENKDKNSEVSINLMEMLEIGVSYRESDDGEKEGNFTPFVIPGQALRTAIKDDNITDEN